jgi:hypothetical protein
MDPGRHPPAAPAGSTAIRTLLWVLRHSAIGAAVAAALLLAILATEYLPAGAARKHLQQSFAEGSLQDQDWLSEDRVRGPNQYNDCLLVMMIRFRTSPWSSAVAPDVIFNSYPPFHDAQGKPVPECTIARAAVAGDNPRGIFKPVQYFSYGRYIHAYRIPFNLLIRYFDVGPIRAAYRICAILLLLATIAAQLGRVASAMRASRPARAVAASCFAGIAAALLLFSGLDLFAQSLTHGPSDILLFSAFAWLSLRGPLSNIRADGEAAALGALAFGFDFLHGTIPMMLAILVGCAALRAFGNALPVRWPSIVRLVAAFTTGIFAAVAVKLAALWSVLGWGGVTSFFGRLIYRINGDSFTLKDEVWALGAAAHEIGWGVTWVAVLVVAAGLAGALFALVRAVSGPVEPEKRQAIVAALASIAVIFVWYIVFRNHTALHAGWMVRLLAWPIGMGCACLALALASGRKPAATASIVSAGSVGPSGGA